MRTLMPALLLVVPLFAGPLDIGGVPGVDASQFRATTFAAGLSSPYGMAADHAGGVLVGAVTPGASFGNGWQILRFTDADHNGVADNMGTPVISGGSGLVTAVANVGPFVAVGLFGTPASIQLFAPAADPDAAYTFLGSIDIGFSPGWGHPSPGLASRPTPGQPGSYDLFFNVGSQTNNAPSPSISLSGLVSATVAADSIYRVTVSPGGGTVQASGLTQVASGIRNAVGMAFEAATGDFLFADNGIDGLINPHEPLSADELNRIAAAALDDPAPDFGFSSAYTTYRTGVVVGSGTQPLVAFQPLGDPQTGSESEGPAGLALSPPGFPTALSNGVFIGFHGRSGAANGLDNEENPVVYVDLATGQYFHFIGNDQTTLNHPDSLLAIAGSLFIADFGLSSNDGAIYQITAVPEPAAWMLAVAGLLAVVAAGRQFGQA